MKTKQPLRDCRVPHLAIIATLSLFTGSIHAGPDTAQPLEIDSAAEPTLAEKIWAIPILIDNPDAGFIQRLAITGRYHGQFYAIDSDHGNDSGYETRRFWLGAKMTMFEKLLLKVDFVLDGTNFDPFYRGLYEAYGAWTFDESLTFGLGRRKSVFTEEFGTSSRKILTVERSLLVNQIHPSVVTGGWLKGTSAGWRYDVGVYSGDSSAEFSDFDAGVGASASLGYDFAHDIEGQNSKLRLDYLYTDGNSGNNAFKPYQNAFSLNYRGDYGNGFGIRTDLLYGMGIDEVADVWGIVLMPNYMITDKLQGVFRYQWAHSEGDNGLRVQSMRYERSLPGLNSTFGDEFHAFYAGLNYYIYGHKLKLMSGVEYSVMEDAANDGGAFKGWTGYAGLRLYF